MNRLVHLSHHDGCRAEIAAVAGELGFAVTDFRPDDGYNIGEQRATAMWRRHRELFAACDWAIVSDTTPLARVLLQNGYAGRLLIWVCNRFDYCDEATNDCGFPDPAYYALLRTAACRDDVAFVHYTAFEHHYARRRGVDLGNVVIEPSGRLYTHAGATLVPADIDRARTFFVPPYHNDTRLLDLAGTCRALDIPVWGGRYGGPLDLRGFRGIIHIPYAWSNFAFFEALSLGLPLLVPSPAFLLELARSPDFFWGPPFAAEDLELAEWYRPEHRDLVVTFDSWEDLKRRVMETDFAALREHILVHAAHHRVRTLRRWREAFQRLGAPV